MLEVLWYEALHIWHQAVWWRYSRLSGYHQGYPHEHVRHPGFVQDLLALGAPQGLGNGV